MRPTYPRATRTLIVIVALTLQLAACQGAATPTVPPTPVVPTPAADTVPCMLNVRIAPATGTPAVAAIVAEEQVRARHNPAGDPQRGQLGERLEARHVTITASSQEWEIGQDRWLFTFAYVPPAPQPSQVPRANLGWRAYAFADTISGFPLNSCSGLMPVSATPAAQP